MEVLPYIQCKAAGEKRNKVIHSVDLSLNSLVENAKMKVEGQQSLIHLYTGVGR